MVEDFKTLHRTDKVDAEAVRPYTKAALHLGGDSHRRQSEIGSQDDPHKGHANNRRIEHDAKLIRKLRGMAILFQEEMRTGTRPAGEV